MTESPDVEALRVPTTAFVRLAPDDGAVVAAALVYRPQDCLAVGVELLGPLGTKVVWTFAWELLARGLMVPAGDGDIIVRPAPGPVAGIEVALVAPSVAALWLPAGDVAAIVRRIRARDGVDEHRIAPALDRELAAITNSV